MCHCFELDNHKFEFIAITHLELFILPQQPVFHKPGHQPHLSHTTCSSSNLTCAQCDSFYMGETKNSLSTRMNGHRSSSNSPDDLPLPVPIHTRSHQLPFNSCWNVRVLHNLPPTNHITCCHLELAYQFILSSRHSPGINLR